MVFKNGLSVEEAVDITQKVTVNKQTRFIVTTCLYLSPNNRARGLSALFAVWVSKDTAQKKIAYNRYCDCYVVADFPIFVRYSYQQSHVQRLHNKTNTEIGCCQVTKQVFGG